MNLSKTCLLAALLLVAYNVNADTSENTLSTDAQAITEENNNITIETKENTDITTVSVEENNDSTTNNEEVATEATETN